MHTRAVLRTCHNVLESTLVQQRLRAPVSPHGSDFVYIPLLWHCMLGTCHYLRLHLLGEDLRHIAAAGEMHGCRRPPGHCDPIRP